MFFILFEPLLENICHYVIDSNISWMLNNLIA